MVGPELMKQGRNQRETSTNPTRDERLAGPDVSLLLEEVSFESAGCRCDGDRERARQAGQPLFSD